MLSAFKRLTGKHDNPAIAGPSRPAHQSMPTTLQRKFAKGVQYNMKIIIKGDRNVGKTCLFHRLQGQKFVEEYIPTEEIQVTSIQWNYKTTDDVVKVEVWDVVDRGRRRRKTEGLKMENLPAENVDEEPALDAEFLDVYKGTNGVIIMMDITKTWTFDYVQRELPKIPENIPVIVLGNHCDMSHHRNVTNDKVSYFIDSFQNRTAQIRYAETSMRNGFGLKLLHKFFNLPFLQLQRETLLKQLETNEYETKLTCQELDLFQDSDDANYNKFLENLVHKRRVVADMASATVLVPNVTSSLSSHGLSSNNSSSNLMELKKSNSISGPIGGGTPIPSKFDVKSPTSKSNSNNNKSNSSSSSNSLIKSIRSSDVTLKDDEKTDGKKKDSFIPKSLQNKLTNDSLLNGNSEPLASVEEFIADDGMLDKSFLDDQQSPQKNRLDIVETDSETETANPLVADFQDDLSSTDEIEQLSTIKIEPRLLENPLSKQKSKKTDIKKRDSISSSEELRIVNDDVNNDQDLTDYSREFNRDSKWRQSPEGGEDIVIKKDKFEFNDLNHRDDNVTLNANYMELLEPFGNNNLNVSSNNSSPVLKEKKSRDKEKDKEEKRRKKKSKNKEKEKDKEKSERRKKKAQRKDHQGDNEGRDELEEFLNGSVGGIKRDGAYEAL